MVVGCCVTISAMSLPVPVAVDTPSMPWPQANHMPACPGADDVAFEYPYTPAGGVQVVGAGQADHAAPDDQDIGIPRQTATGYCAGIGHTRSRPPRLAR